MLRSGNENQGGKAASLLGLRPRSRERGSSRITNAIQKADLLLHGGAILSRPDADSVAVRGSRIGAIGRSDDLRALVGPRTRVVNLHSRFVAPGFIDCHLHFLEAAAAFSGVDLSGCQTLAELLTGLADAAHRASSGQWIRAYGCDEALIADKRGPTRDELDDAAAHNPLRLRHRTLHASWLNSRAIEALGLDDSGFVAPPGAQIERDARGRPTGFAVAMEEWITSRLPAVSQCEIETRARNFSRELTACGVTGFTDATARNGPDEVALFARLKSSGAIAQRVSMMLGARHLDSAHDALLLARDGGISIIAAKFMPHFADDPSQLAEQVGLCLDLGFDCAFHATELEELALALDAFESAKLKSAASATQSRLRIEHGGLITPNFIERLAALGAWVVTNPGFIYFRGRKYVDEPGLAAHLYRIKSLITAGVNLAGATDAPVTPARPLAAIAAASARTSRDGVVLASQERVTPAEAVALFTNAAALLSRAGTGEIAVGEIADLVVLPRNPLTLDWKEMIDMRADMTIAAGQIVYDRESSDESPERSEILAAESASHDA